MTTSPVSCANDDLVARVGSNLTAIRTRIVATGRDLSSIRIVAVTKTFGVDALVAAAANGLGDVGENYVDELEQKRERCRDLGLSTYFLGALQSNKIARVARVADVICSVSRVKELEKIAALASRPSLYVQVDYTGGAQRNGVDAADAASLVERARRLELDVRGVMTVAAPGLDQARVAFTQLARLHVDLGLEECSMGMSDDLEIACELGTSELRIGRALFGERATPVAP